MTEYSTRRHCSHASHSHQSTSYIHSYTRSSICCHREAARCSVCLVSFKSTIPRAQSFVTSYCSFRLTNAIECSLILLRCLWRYINASRESTVCREQQTTPRVSSTCHGPAKLCVSHLAVEPLSTRNEVRCRSRIAFLPTHLHSTPYLGQSP